jgi:hypothetical protein
MGISKLFDAFSKRELVAIIGAIFVVCALSAWGSIFVIKKYVIGERDDPLYRAGGLNPDQAIQAK